MPTSVSIGEWSVTIRSPAQRASSALRAPHWRSCCATTAIASRSVTSKSSPATGMNPASGALSSRWLTCRTWCGGAPGPKTPLIISPIWISLAAPRQAGRRWWGCGAGESGGGCQTVVELGHGSDGTWRTPAGWTAFYDSLTVPPVDEHRGALPFRAAQLYGLMVDAVRGDDVPRYVATAGVLAHYVGDACQPLHVSRLHHGVPGAGEAAGPSAC